MWSIVQDQAGFTGAERALVAAVGLLLAGAAGRLVGAGGQGAAADAERVLAQGRGAIGAIASALPIQGPRALDPAGHIGDASLYPDPTLTPGATFPDVTAAQVCTPGYAKGVRNVTPEEKAQVYQRYGIPDTPGQHEVDHFISLELGGSNDISNLWPEPYEPRPGAHEKDKVENYLHDQVCSGAMTLQQAQDAIRTDWYAVYLKMEGGAPAQGQGQRSMASP